MPFLPKVISLNANSKARQVNKLIYFSHCAIKNPPRGARGVMVIVVGNGHGDTSPNPRRE